MDNYFAREAEIMASVYDWIKISSEHLHLIGTFTKLYCLNVKLLFSMSL